MGSRNLVLAIVTLMLTIPLSAEKKHSALGRADGRPVAHVDDFVRQGLPGPPASSLPMRRARNSARWPSLISQNKEDTNAQIAYWDAGSPAYRWMDLISNRLLAGTPTTAFRASRLHLRQHGDVRRDDRRLGIEVSLPPAEAERVGSQISDGRGCARQPVVSIRTRRSGAGRCQRAGLLSPERGAELSGHGRSSGMVARAGRRSVPE